MRQRQRFILTTMLGHLGLLWLASSNALAERILPGVQRGTYHIDRWGQHRFSYLFVSPELEKTLKPYLRTPVILEATEVRQWMNPGGAIIMRVGKVEKLPMPVKISLSWQEPKKGPTALLRRVPAGGSIKVKVTVTNRSHQKLLLDGRNFYLSFYLHHPSGAGFSDPMDFWAMHESYTPFGSDKERRLCKRMTNLLPHDQTFNASVLPIAYSPYPRIENAHTLKQGESHSWTVTLEKLPANEYELAALYDYPERQHPYPIFSNVLRVDALTDKPLRWQGLEVELKPDGERQGSAGQPIPLQVRFKNTTQKPLRFGWVKIGQRVDLSDALLCYDEKGTLLPLPIPAGKRRVETIRLEPGKSLSVQVEAPAHTAVARVVFGHCVVVRDTQPDETPVSTGYILSSHRRLQKSHFSRAWTVPALVSIALACEALFLLRHRRRRYRQVALGKSGGTVS